MSICTSKTLKHLNCLILFFSLFAFFNKPSNAQCTNTGCVDCFNWCQSSQSYCHIGAIRTNCRKTCKTCPTEAPACLELNCAQKCILSDDGRSAQCACHDGFQLDADGRTCNDIDECAVSSAVCQNSSTGSHCVNLLGEFACLTCQATDNQRFWNYYGKDECCLRNHAEKCGKSTTTGGRIVGGMNSKIARWPWTAYLRISQELCGGTLITRRHVLTAAHCVWNVRSTNLQLITVLLGVDEVDDITNVHVQTRSVIRMNIHPNYNYPLHDIAILELNQPVTISTFANTICLSDGEEPEDGTICYASGYGATSYLGNPSNELQEVALPIVNDAACERAYSRQANRVNSTYHICAGYTEGGRDTCQGDSGGPLVCQRCKNCDWYLAGITAFGRECARSGFYGVFTRTRVYEKWITDITRQTYVSASKPRCVKASWHPWAQWTSCSATCGVGKRTRIRVCVNGEEGDPGCIGSRSEIANCSAAACTGWTQWSSCSETCGNGQQRRERLGEVQTKQCNVRYCPTWSEFRSWSECTQTCGGGVRRAFRVCLYDVANGGGCFGSNQRTQQCNTQCCPHWSEFGEYSNCRVTCGGGFQVASRTCKCARADGSGCDGNELSFRACGAGDCPAEFSQWSEYGQCSAICDGGERVRTRSCSVSGRCAADEHGIATEQRQSCNTPACSSGWTPWSNVGSCSQTCGNGSMSQVRRCVGGNPGNSVCPGTSTRSIQCHLGSCPAEWGPYTPFTSCSVTCGEGIQYRTRECIGGAIGTENCIGKAREEKTCRQSSCAAASGTSKDCSSVADLIDSTSCCNYAKLGYCSPSNQYQVYMSQNCANSCCKYNRDQSCESRGCSDYFPQSTCRYLVVACQSNAFIQQGCKASCGLC